jgi:hypothetical protein
MTPDQAKRRALSDALELMAQCAKTVEIHQEEDSHSEQEEYEDLEVNP